MSESTSINAEHGRSPPLKWWVAVPLSLAIALHFGFVLVHVVYAKSGPWQVFRGPGFGWGGPPPFIPERLAESANGYLTALHLNDAFQLPSCRVSDAEVAFEAVLYGQDGKETRRIRFPDPGHWWGTRAREAMFANALNEDEQREAGAGENIPAAGEQGRSQWVWKDSPRQPNSDEPPSLTLELVPTHLISRTEPVYGPSAWSMAAAHSYANYFLRTYGASSVEIRRQLRPRLVPAIMTPEAPELSKDQFMEGSWSFGKVSDAATSSR